MEKGRIAQTGAPPQLYRSPNSRFVAAFLGESNFLTAVLLELKEDRATVRLADGTVLSGVAIGIPGGYAGAVDVLIRPERLDVADGASPPAGQANRIAGTLDMVNFLGSQQEYEVRTSGGRLAVRSYLRSASSAHPIGSPVTLCFSTDDCLVFPASGAAP